MRHQSFWRLLEPTEALLEELARDIDTWIRLHRDGDKQWWNLTHLARLPKKVARRLGLKIRKGMTDVKNPFFNSKEEPKCHADYRIFVMGESATAETFGIALEMETLAKWSASVTESASKILATQRTTKQVQNSLKRKLEGLFEFIKEYGKNAPRFKEITDELMIADDRIRKADLLLTVNGGD